MQNLLIVEDEHDSAAVVEMILQPSGLPFMVAEDAYQAIEILKNNPGGFVGVIIDLALPGKDGFSLLQEIRSLPQLAHLATFAMTAYHTPELKSRCIKAGFHAYFPKPLDTSLFLGTLDRILSR